MWSLLDLLPEEFSISILDVGASLWEEPPYQPLIDRERAVLTGFEPDEQACQELKERYGKPHRFLPYFIGDGTERVFYETNWGATGSLFEPNTELLEKFQNLAELTTTVATHPVSTVTLDSLQEAGEIENIDFFKIDVQGSELSVFENAVNVLGDTLAIQTKVEFVELYKDQPLFADVDPFLRDRGFKFFSFLTVGTRSFKPLFLNDNPYLGRQQLWSDALYVRDWLHLDRLSELQLKKYAVLMHDIFGIYDFAHFILTALDRKTTGTLADTYLTKLVTPQ